MNGHLDETSSSYKFPETPIGDWPDFFSDVTACSCRASFIEQSLRGVSPRHLLVRKRPSSPLSGADSANVRLPPLVATSGHSATSPTTVVRTGTRQWPEWAQSGHERPQSERPVLGSRSVALNGRDWVISAETRRSARDPLRTFRTKGNVVLCSMSLPLRTFGIWLMLLQWVAQP